MKDKIEKELPEMDKGEVRVRGRARVQRFRATHRRIDYAPSAGALTVIEKHLSAKLDNCLAGVIDQLIKAGDKAISGNGGS